MNAIDKSPLRFFPSCVMAAALSFSVPAMADFTLILPAGIACDFELQIDGSGGKQIQRDFFDTDGNLVRTLGRNGLGAHITSLGTEATLALPQSTGAVSHVRRSRLDADG